MTRPLASRNVFVSGGTGYVGVALITRLLERGHAVRAIARATSMERLPRGCEGIAGNALDEPALARHAAGCDTFVQLVGTPHPAPWKGRSFREVDLVAGLAAAAAARRASVRHLVYLSVAHPAPIMREYIAVRRTVEARIIEEGLDATLVRPWYVLGPGHRWPHALRPLYALAESISSTRDSAIRLGLVTLSQIVTAMVETIEAPPVGIRVLDVASIRATRS